MDWAVSDSVGSTLRQIRTIDPDRPIKVHAYDSSAWGYKITSELGGYSHHTPAPGPVGLTPFRNSTT